MISPLRGGDGPASQPRTGVQTYLSTIEFQSQILAQGFYSDKSAARGGDGPPSQLWTGAQAYLSTTKSSSVFVTYWNSIVEPHAGERWGTYHYETYYLPIVDIL